MSRTIGETVLARLQLLGHLSEADKAAVRSIPGQIRLLEPGEAVLREGERPTTSVVVLRGFMHRYSFTAQGARQIHSFYMVNDTPSFEAVPMEMMDNTLAAVTPCEVGVITHPDIMELMDARPNVGKLIWRETLVQGAVVREWLMRNSQMVAPAAMAHLFCEIMTRATVAGIASGDGCELPVTQEHLADALGMSAVHVNRTLMVLRSGGLVEFQQGRLTIPDMSKLVEVAEFDPSYLHLHGPAAGAV